MAASGRAIQAATMRGSVGLALLLFHSFENLLGGNVSREFAQLRISAEVDSEFFRNICLYAQESRNLVFCEKADLKVEFRSRIRKGSHSVLTDQPRMWIERSPQPMQPSR